MYRKGQKNHEISKTYLVMVFQFRIRKRKMHGWIQKFSEASFATNFRIIRLFSNSTTNRSHLERIIGTVLNSVYVVIDFQQYSI
jgi:hypothetical protein